MLDSTLNNICKDFGIKSPKNMARILSEMTPKSAANILNQQPTTSLVLVWQYFNLQFSIKTLRHLQKKLLLDY